MILEEEIFKSNLQEVKCDFYTNRRFLFFTSEDAFTDLKGVANIGSFCTMLNGAMKKAVNKIEEIEERLEEYPHTSVSFEIIPLNIWYKKVLGILFIQDSIVIL